LDVSIFEIIGPIMIGPSSSHTAGMARIARMARNIIGIDPKKINITLHPAIMHTYKGHKTDVAIIGGLMGIQEDDELIKDAYMIAFECNIEIIIDFLKSTDKNPNTIVLTIESEKGINSITGISIGGGSFIITNIDGAEVNLGGSVDYLFITCSSNNENEINNVLNSSESYYKNIIERGFVKTNNEYLFWVSFAGIIPKDMLEIISGVKEVTEARIVPSILPFGASKWTQQLYGTISELLELTSNNKSLFDVVLQYEMSRSGKTSDEIIRLMAKQLDVMKNAIDKGLNHEITLLAGITSGVDGKLLAKSVIAGSTLSGEILPMAIARALATMEVNGSMGIVVASPTAGSCGIIPGCLLTIKEYRNMCDLDVIRALIVAGGLGVTLAHAGASFSGVVGGCQGEVGVSSALAAAGLVELVGGSPMQVVQAMTLALKNILGLVCDPIAGPVEVPCIKRNAIGVANAFASADMALAGIESAIPSDEVILALKNVQQLLPPELKGTTIGGLACTPTAKKIKEKCKKYT